MQIHLNKNPVLCPLKKLDGPDQRKRKLLQKKKAGDPNQEKNHEGLGQEKDVLSPRTEIADRDQRRKHRNRKMQNQGIETADLDQEIAIGDPDQGTEDPDQGIEGQDQEKEGPGIEGPGQEKEEGQGHGIVF